MGAEETDEAVDAWKRVLELLPTDGEALDSIGTLLGKAGRVQELIDVLKRQLAMAEEPQRRAGLLFQMGSLQQDQMKDAGGALATFRRLLEIAPEEPNALERMDRLCEAQERWPELADVLARRLKVTQGEALFTAKYRLGLVRETRLLDKAGAIELYTEPARAATPGTPARSCAWKRSSPRSRRTAPRSTCCSGRIAPTTIVRSCRR